MKKRLLVSMLFLFALRANAACGDTAHAGYPSAAVSIGYGVCPAFGRTTGSLEIGAEVRLAAHWNVGLLAFVAGQKLNSGYGYVVEQPGLSLASVGLSGGYSTAIRGRVSLGASIMSGVTSATLQDRSESKLIYAGRSVVRQYKAVDKSTFFLVQPSLSLGYHISRVVTVAINGRYDFNWGRTHWVAASDFSGARADIGFVITPAQ